MGLLRLSSTLWVALLASSSRSTPVLASAGGGPSTVVLVDPSGSVSRSPPPGVLPSASNGVVAVVGDYASLGLSGEDGSVSASSVSGSDDGDGPIVLTARYAPGATGSSGAGARGVGAASVHAGAVVVAGETSGDVERGLGDSRAGRTLAAVFAAKLSSAGGGGAPAPAAAEGEEEGAEKEEGRTLLIVAVNPEGDDEVDEEATLAGVRAVFDAEAAAAGSGAALEDVYEVRVAGVADEEDAAKVLEEAASAASRSPLASSSSATTSVPSAVADAYAKFSSPSGSGATHDGASEPPAVAAALLACDSASARHRRSSRARLLAWKSRTGRGLTVERFGKEADSLLQGTLDRYDRDTAVAAGLVAGGAARYRLESRTELRGRVEKGIRELFEAQVANLRRRALRNFDKDLLRATRSAERTGLGTPHDERAIARRTALFAFVASVEDLEVPRLGLTKSRAAAEMEGALNDALVAFEDSPSAKLRTVEEVKKTAAKERKPTERSVDAKIDLVAMVRPDGYGNLQGFVGYQTPWGSQVTVGVQNDADSPDVISQFGGVRPPFLRVQPKLKLDIEL